MKNARNHEPQISDECVALMERLACTRPSKAEAAILRAALGEDVVVRHVVLEGVPFAFRSRWDWWERTRNVVRERLGTRQECIRLTGSANQGTSFVGERPFEATRSDLDIFLIDSQRFDELHTVATSLVEAGRFANRPDFQRRVEKQLRRGFIQTTFLPPRTPVLAPYQRCVRSVKRSLRGHPELSKVKKVSFRVYRDEEAALRQLGRSLV